MQIDLILGVLAFSGIVLTLVIVIIGARSKLVSTGDVSIEINGDSSNPFSCSCWFKITSNTC
jgi:Na+-transporting NADH:ubiquinone oxidoreductase subunit F